MKKDTIILHGVTGIARRMGKDQHGCFWTEFEVDRFAEQEDGECRICGKTIPSGWVCLDGGDEVCADHVLIEEGGE
jgi:hypothetical protein